MASWQPTYVCLTTLQRHSGSVSGLCWNFSCSLRTWFSDSLYDFFFFFLGWDIFCLLLVPFPQTTSNKVPKGTIWNNFFVISLLCLGNTKFISWVKSNLQKAWRSNPQDHFIKKSQDRLVSWKQSIKKLEMAYDFCTVLCMLQALLVLLECAWIPVPSNRMQTLIVKITTKIYLPCYRKL